MGVWLEAIVVNRFPPGSGRQAPSIFFSFCHPSMLSHVLMECPSPHFHSSCSQAHQIQKSKPVLPNHTRCGWVGASSKGPAVGGSLSQLIASDTDYKVFASLGKDDACIAHPKLWRGFFPFRTSQSSFVCHEPCQHWRSASLFRWHRFDIVSTAFLLFWHCFWSNSSPDHGFCFSHVIARNVVIFASDSHLPTVHQIHRIWWNSCVWFQFLLVRRFWWWFNKISPIKHATNKDFCTEHNLLTCHSFFSKEYRIMPNRRTCRSNKKYCGDKVCCFFWNLKCKVRQTSLMKTYASP